MSSGDSRLLLLSLEMGQEIIVSCDKEVETAISCENWGFLALEPVFLAEEVELKVKTVLKTKLVVK